MQPSFVIIALLFSTSVFAGAKDTTDICNAKIGDAVILKNVYFSPATAYVLPGTKPVLEKLLLIMKDNPNLKIQVEGHACCTFPERDKKYPTPSEIKMDDEMEKEAEDISEARAEAIYYYLVRNGISENRLRYKGFGTRKPLVVNGKTNINDTVNRRVEIKILSK